MIFDFVGSIFMSQNDNGRKPNFLFSCRRGPSQSNGMARAGWLPWGEIFFKNKIQRPIAWHQIHMFAFVCVCVCVCALVYVEISMEDGGLYCTFDGTCPLTLP
jgi:hypothetical protein